MLHAGGPEAAGVTLSGRRCDFCTCRKLKSLDYAGLLKFCAHC